MIEKINIGIPIDLARLLDTRMLIQAGSGGGKSFALRKLAEAASGHVQQIILDPEGEFVTLREKFDFALVAKEGDIPLSLKYAEMLAHKLLETNLSAIIDLYELKHHERILFVKRFLDAIVNAPKDLWHPALVYVDEAHIFCPESSKSESAGSVIDLCTRGRKRGYCAILATQRLSKLHKDAAAECLNKMIGQTGLDIDRKRAGEELGMVNKQEVLNLRQLNPGEFFAFGPAISNEVKKFKVAPVTTTHLRSGSRQAVKPPTPNAVKKILSKLESIPEEAEKELQTRQQLQAEVTRLRTELTKAQKAQATKPADQVWVKELKQEIVNREKKISEKDTEIVRLASALEKYEERATDFADVLHQVADLLTDSHAAPDKKLPDISRKFPKSSAFVSKTGTSAQISTQRRTDFLKTSTRPPRPVQNVNTSGEKLGKCSLAIFKFLASFPDRFWSKAQVGIATGYSPGSGGFNNSLSELTSRGLISREGGLLQLGFETDVHDILGSDFQPQEYSIHTFMDKLGKCEREIYQVLLDDPHEVFSKDQLAAQTETQYSSGSGGFNNALSTLNTLELIRRENGRIRLNPELLDI